MSQQDVFCSQDDSCCGQGEDTKATSASGLSLTERMSEQMREGATMNTEPPTLFFLTELSNKFSPPYCNSTDQKSLKVKVIQNV